MERAVEPRRPVEAQFSLPGKRDVFKTIDIYTSISSEMERRGESKKKKKKGGKSNIIINRMRDQLHI